MSDFGNELVEAMGQALAHARGEAVPGLVVHRIAVMTAKDVRSIRARTGLSRVKFAECFSLDPRAVRDWEQGRRLPDRAARVLLLTIANIAGSRQPPASHDPATDSGWVSSRVGPASPGGRLSASAVAVPSGTKAAIPGDFRV